MFLACCVLPDKKLTVIAFTDANIYATSMAQGKVKSDGFGSKGLTHCTCLCYRCCALEEET